MLRGFSENIAFATRYALVDFNDNVIKVKNPKAIKNKINKGNWLLKCFKRNPNLELKQKSKISIARKCVKNLSHQLWLD